MTRPAEIDYDRLREAYRATGSQAKAAAALGFTDRTLNRRRKTDAVLAKILDEERGAYLEKQKQAKPHGRSRYVDGCRCEECRQANREYHAATRAARARRSPEDIPHGLGGYRNYGCRCEICSQAASRANALYRELVARRKAEERRRNGLAA